LFFYFLEFIEAALLQTVQWSSLVVKQSKKFPMYISGKNTHRIEMEEKDRNFLISFSFLVFPPFSFICSRKIAVQFFPQPQNEFLKVDQVNFVIQNPFLPNL
jgi:hypothetical protein